MLPCARGRTLRNGSFWGAWNCVWKGSGWGGTRVRGGPFGLTEASTTAFLPSVAWGAGVRAGCHSLTTRVWVMVRQLLASPPASPRARGRPAPAASGWAGLLRLMVASDSLQLGLVLLCHHEGNTAGWPAPLGEEEPQDSSRASPQVRAEARQPRRDGLAPGWPGNAGRRGTHGLGALAQQLLADTLALWP